MSKQVVILGAGGRMGGALVRCLLADMVEGLRLAGAVDIPEHPSLGEDLGILAGAGASGITLSADAEAVVPEADVLIDFRAHRSTGDGLDRLVAWGKPVVIGSTGLTEAQSAAVTAAAEHLPVVQAPNMSLGINLLLALVEAAATALKDKGYDIEIVERHHRHKKDAPSGTALALGRAAAAGYELDLDTAACHGRTGDTGERPERQIGFHAVRGGDFVGDHEVLFAAPGECLEFRHRATSRNTFALGALRAAAWVVGKPPGRYGMRDVLGLAGGL